MPLMRYFGFVGSTLLLLLLILNWCLPQVASEPIHADIDRPVIRISSVEQLPERADIDTSLPTIVPSPEISDRWPEVEIADSAKAQVRDAEPLPRSTIPIKHDVAMAAKKPAKRRTLNSLAALPSAPISNRQFSSGYAKQLDTTPTRVSLLHMIKERFGRGFLRLN
jgi:hypothetical protein